MFENRWKWKKEHRKDALGLLLDESTERNAFMQSGESQSE